MITEQEYLQNPWIFNQKPFTSDDISEYYGFVYMITNKTNNRKYIGRKYLYKSMKKKGKRRVFTESDWKEYYSSSKDLQADVALWGKDCFSREILSLHKTKGDTNYWETKELFTRNVLEALNESGERLYYNANIMSRYFYHGKNIAGRLLSESYYK